MPLKRFNRDLIFARAYYFAYLGGWGFTLPFINLFYVSLGLRGTQIGTIGSVSSVVGLIVSPVLVKRDQETPTSTRHPASLLDAGYNCLFRSRSSNSIPADPACRLFAGAGRLRDHACVGCN